MTAARAGDRGGASSRLAVHTTEPEASLAVLHAGRVISESFAAAGVHAPVVLESIVRIMARAGATFDDLESIAVTTGPGSFTGIRVGLASVQGLAAARHLPVWTADSLRARAAAHRGSATAVGVVLDARRGEVYAGLYDVREALPIVLLDALCASPDDAAAALGAAADRTRLETAPVLDGSGAELVADRLAGWRTAAALPVPVAHALLDLARAGGCTAVAPEAVQPTYLRKSDAEVARDRRRTADA